VADDIAPEMPLASDLYAPAPMTLGEWEQNRERARMYVLACTAPELIQ
jgi:hypothetical protein